MLGQKPPSNPLTKSELSNFYSPGRFAHSLDLFCISQKLLYKLWFLEMTLDCRICTAVTQD